MGYEEFRERYFKDVPLMKWQIEFVDAVMDDPLSPGSSCPRLAGMAGRSSTIRWTL